MVLLLVGDTREKRQRVGSPRLSYREHGGLGQYCCSSVYVPWRKMKVKLLKSNKNQMDNQIPLTTLTPYR